MAKRIQIGGRIESKEVGGIVTGAAEILDDAKEKKQSVINQETEDELVRLDQSKQDNLTFDNAPTEGSDNPVKSGGVYAADKALSDAIEAILLLIPSAASALNKLVDTAMMNSSISTATATFKGTYNVVTDLELDIDATHEQIAAALGNAISAADNNDYAFVQVPVSAESTDIRRTERYKFNGTVWGYEYDLNTSGFTAAQWAALNSGITIALVGKLIGLPTSSELQALLGQKQNTLTFDNVPTAGSANPVKSGGVYSAINDEKTAREQLAQTVTGIDGRVGDVEEVIPTGAAANNKLVANSSMEAYVTSIIDAITASFTIATADGHINLTLTQTNGRVASLTLTSSDIASAQALTALTGRVSTAESNITSLGGRVSTNETDIANLQQLYNNLQQSKPVPVDALPETGQQQGVIYRLSGTTSYSDYMWNGSTWVLMATYNNAIDPRPKKASQNLVTSGGVFDNMGALDVSELNATENPHTLAQYIDLSAALAAIPTDYQKGGMSIKFVQSSDNKYVQYRLKKNQFSTDVNDWNEDCDAVLQDRMESFSKMVSMSANTDITESFVASNEQVATLKNNIVLSKDGDSIEFVVKSCSYPPSDNKHNAFARNPNNSSKIAIAIAVNFVAVRTDDNTWIFEYSTEAIGKTFKISFENGNIVLYKNEVAVLTYSGQKALTIDSFGNGSQGSGNYGYWDGSIENLKINGILISLKDLCATFTATESVFAHKFTSNELSDIADIPNIKSDIVELNGKVDNLIQPQKYIFDSSQESYFTLTTPIVLSQNGDSLQFKIDRVPQYYGEGINKSYCLGYNPNNSQKIALGASNYVLAVRADDSTWLCDIAAQNTLANGDVIKVSYEGGNVITYKNGIAVATYTGQKTLTIASFGDGSKGNGNYGYWDGTISNIKVNGYNYALEGTNHNVSIENVALSAPQMLIAKTASVITLYLLYKGNKYIGYPINYRYKAYTADEYPSFYDNWGVGRIFIADYDAENNSMSVNQYLFSTGEAELSVETPNVKYGETGQAQYKFSGGVMHGFENIVTESGARKFMLLINNISYTESSVIPLTAIESFDLYTQTQICQAYTNENPYGLVNKHWFVKDGFFQIRTTMKMLRSIYLNQSEFGMFCIYRHAEGDASKPYLTNRAIENDDIFKAYDVSDDWESDSANNKLKVSNYATSEIILYGQEDMGFSMKIVDANTIAPASGGQNGGGMSMATNGGNAYNKVYFDLTGHYTPNVDDELYATQVWGVK